MDAIGLPNCGHVDDGKGTRVGSAYKNTKNTMVTMAEGRANENGSGGDDDGSFSLRPYGSKRPNN